MNKEVMSLNTRQWKLYGYLVNNKNSYKNVKEIIDDTGIYGPVQEINFNNSKGRRLLTSDIRMLKNSDLIQTIILSTNDGIKIANIKEFEEHLEKEEISVLKRLKLIHKQKKKAGLNNQTRIVFGQEKPIIEAFK